MTPKWFKVSISDTVKAPDAQSAITVFLEILRARRSEDIADIYTIGVEEEGEDGD